jgi:hypothetical protein
VSNQRDSEVEAADAEGLTLLGALQQLKDDIIQLQQRSGEKGVGPMFLIEEGELELKLVARKDRKAEAKGVAKFRLFLAANVEASASGAMETSKEHTQTLKIKFKALPPRAAASTHRGIGFESAALAGVAPQSPEFKTEADPQG